METRKYEVTIIEKKGSCDNSLFEKMSKKGDLTSTKITEVLGQEVSILGYAECNIVTESTDFNIIYFDTAEYGLLSSGSQIFFDSVKTYFGEVEKVRITEVKTKKGKTYKAVPVLGKKDDDLPF